ncbi:MAG: hypothetical protein M1834_005161 [Cirrosporium novae-zelandiae]|nr:MAG: hypothetical protein M1834_005161 [Cirrosporium novae-zelandiae]
MLTDYLLSPYFILLIPVLFYILPYLKHSALRGVPTPFPAAFTNLWLLYQCRSGKRYLAVDEAHKKYGPLVRIQPDHISVADPKAVQIIYGHGNGYLKRQRGLFNTRDRTEHTRKRKTVAHTFSPKSISQFEQYMHSNLVELVKQWSQISASSPSGSYAGIDALHWFNYLAFDIIGDLAFGAPFGMLPRNADVAEVQSYPGGPITTAPAIEVLNRRGEVSATLGCIPQLKQYAKWLPDRFFRDGLAAVENLAGIATARVNVRLDTEKRSERVDLLARLMEGKDEQGNRLGRQELTAEALTQLIAGSDTTSNTICALLYWCLKTPGVINQLQEELDGIEVEENGVPTFEAMKDLPYVNAVIQETLRIHSTSSLGLPRQIPACGPPLKLHGYTFPPGTVLSVPTYTMHHSTTIWGPDADSFRPSRWPPYTSKLTEKQQEAFNPFSYGPRACVGRNVAEMEMKVIVGTVFRNFAFEKRQEELETREGFLRKPLGLNVGMRKR